MENPDSRDAQSPDGTPFSLNFSVALNEERGEPTARGNRHWKALSSVSFHVELVSSSIGSFCSELTAKSTFSMVPLFAETRDQGTTNNGLENEQQDPKASTTFRRMQSAPSSLLEAMCGAELAAILTDEAKVELGMKEAPRRHTLNNCDEGDLHLAAEKLFNNDTSPTKLHSAAFQSSKTRVKNTKRPPRIPSLKQHSSVLNQRMEHPNTYNNNNATTSAGVSTQPRRRQSKNTSKRAQREIKTNDLSPTRLVNGGGGPSRRSFVGSKGLGLDRTCGSRKKRESSVKRVMTSLLKCFCSDGTAEKEEAEIHSSRNTIYQ